MVVPVAVMRYTRVWSALLSITRGYNDVSSVGLLTNHSASCCLCGYDALIAIAMSHRFMHAMQRCVSSYQVLNLV